MTNREDCMENVPKIFKIVDLDGDGTVSKCEDATFQNAAGSTLEYALKFAGSATVETAKWRCNNWFM